MLLATLYRQMVELAPPGESDAYTKPFTGSVATPATKAPEGSGIGVVAHGMGPAVAPAGGPVVEGVVDRVDPDEPIDVRRRDPGRTARIARPASRDKRAGGGPFYTGGGYL